MALEMDPMGPGWLIFFYNEISESHGGGGARGPEVPTTPRPRSRPKPREIYLPDKIDPIIDHDQLLLEDDELLLLIIKAIESGTI